MTDAAARGTRLYGTARFVAKAGKERELEAALTKVVEQTSREPGSLRLNLIRSKDQPAIFHIHSVWKDEAALHAHMEQPYVRQFLATGEDLQAETASVSFGLPVTTPSEPA